jgi:tetratricopeptide (TPR) repeat protein
MNLKNYFNILEHIYEKLDEILIPASRNCSNCCICCLNIKDDVFTLIETEYIYEHVFKGKKTFEEILYSVSNNIICPFCDLEKGGCTIYNYRPLLCRRWGPFVDEVYSYMFKCCVYSKDVHIFPPEKKKELPFVRELYSLNELYMKNRGMKTMKNPEKTEKDIKDLESAMEISTHKVPLLTLIGRGYAKQGDTDRADCYYSKAVNIDPLYDFAWYLKGLNSYGRQDYEQAEIELTKAKEINPENVNISSFLIMFYIGQNRYFEAKKEIDFLIKRYPPVLERFPFIGEL